MKYFKVDHSFHEASEDIDERYELAKERLFEIPEEGVLSTELEEYFGAVSSFLQSVIAHYEEHILSSAEMTCEECENIQTAVFYDLMPENYDESFLSPVFAKKKLGELGGILSCVYADALAAYAWATEDRRDLLVIMMELVLQLYGVCDLSEEDELQERVMHEVSCFYHDYLDVFSSDAVREMVCPETDYYDRIIMDSDLSEPSYLYRFGCYITENEKKLSAFIATLSDEQVQSMADTLTEGYRIGFEVTRKDLSKKGTVIVEYPIGLERVTRQVIKNFEKLGLRSVFFRESVLSTQGRRTGRASGVFSTPINKQFLYDHREDKAYYFDKAYVERELEVRKETFEKYSKDALLYSGPAVTELFGDKVFAPVNHEEAKRYSDEQNELFTQSVGKKVEMFNKYIPGDETSFSIISYPTPEIGDRFEEVFAETVKLNTLDYMSYRNMQQNIIDVLDRGTAVHVLGAEGNDTDITVQLYKLTDPEKQTIFENCVADVNIPVGEVFTSPVLEGTEGTLHVSHVYLGDYHFKDLRFEFKDGRVSDYSCKNFEDEAENKKLIYDNIMHKHDTLPLGEFAIGTNTTAYKVGRQMGILDKFPILIAEKTGPHFAVGDTCYSFSEDVDVFNPDGKEIVARDNSVSILRKTDPAKAYLNCHTDITIPFEELKLIEVICADGERIPVIKDGRFVVEGCQDLNIPLEELENAN